MINIERVKYVCGNLDIDLYGKGCNYPAYEDGKLIFYSRDYCYNISFGDLIKWYLGYINLIDEDDYASREEINLCLERRYDLLIELIEIYTFYKIESTLFE